MYSTIPIQKLDRYLEQGFEGRVVDLRKPSDFVKGHILGAENYPYDELMSTSYMLPADRPVIFYCSRGSESLLACNFFSKKGYQVINVANGINLYRGKYLTQE